jgi:hypothetical protein
MAFDVAVLAVGLGIFTLAVWLMAPFVPDDAYISYRYAAHLAGGAGLRFNPTAAPVEGYSNFLWIVLLAPAARLGLNLVAAGTWLGSLLGAAAIVALWAILRRRGASGLRLAAPVGLLALSPASALYAVSGMETALFALLLLAVVLVADGLLHRSGAGWGLLLALVGAAAALARPEGVVVFPVVAFCLAVFAPAGQRRPVWRAVGLGALLFAALLAGYHVWRVAYFGAFWPTPFLAKGAGGSIIDPWLTNLRQFFVRQTHYYTPMVYYYVAIALPAAFGLWTAWRRGRRPAVESTAFLLALALGLIYINFVDWMPGMRYYAPLVGLLLVPYSLLGAAERVAGGPRDESYALLVAALALFSLSGLAALRLDGGQLQASTQASLVELGHWLRQTMPPDATLAMSDVGATPYYSGLRTVDINPQSLTDRHIAENGWSADYFFSVDPDVVVITAFSLTRPDFYSAHEELYASPRFQAAYERAGVVRNDWYQDRAYWVFVRRGAAPGPEAMAAFPAGITKP